MTACPLALPTAGTTSGTGSLSPCICVYLVAACMLCAAPPSATLQLLIGGLSRAEARPPLLFLFLRGPATQLSTAAPPNHSSYLNSHSQPIPLSRPHRHIFSSHLLPSSCYCRVTPSAPAVAFFHLSISEWLIHSSCYIFSCSGGFPSLVTFLWSLYIGCLNLRTGTHVYLYMCVSCRDVS